MKVVVVEDEQRAREGLCRLLREIPGNHEMVAQASNGQAALELILQLKPDVVFTDIKMPFLDGLTLARTVRAHNLPTEFIIISAYGDFELARQSILLDVAEYILKPVTQEDVMNALARAESRIRGKRSYSVQKASDLREKYPDAHPIILRALDIIQARYAGKINQRELAADLGISPEYFSYLFSKNVRETFSSFLQRYRIKRAQELYRTGTCDKREVPYAVGFSDAKYFSQVFRKITGMSPSEYLSEFDR